MRAEAIPHCHAKEGGKGKISFFLFMILKVWMQLFPHSQKCTHSKKLSLPPCCESEMIVEIPPWTIIDMMRTDT